MRLIFRIELSLGGRNSQRYLNTLFISTRTYIAE
jgi:hypothetical protein